MSTQTAPRTAAPRIALAATAVLGVVSSAILAFVPVPLMDGHNDALTSNASVLSQFGSGVWVIVGALVLLPVVALLLKRGPQRIVAWVAALVLVGATFMNIYGTIWFVLPVAVVAVVAALALQLTAKD